MWKKVAAVTGALLLLGVGLVTLTAFSGGGWCGRGHGHRDPAQAAAFVTDRVEDALDDLDATPEQRTRILAVKDRMLDSAKALHGDRKETHDALFQEWKSERPDAARLHALVDARTEEMRKLAHEAVDAGIEVHDVLTPEQRAKLTRKVERWHR
ncbi:MAG TPA: Spy/CpxP family protein refolding chaperone [Anaeromyxobacter sp.]|nr:Spy/CpxP family protein refolding chaperone [Anaeromyxobacter sp.]